MGKNIEKLAEFVAQTRWEDVPKLVRQHTKLVFLDTLGVILAGGERPRLFQVYSAGNFIEATSDTPFLQIGEHKYGKPVLDRAVKYETEIYDALKIGLISMDSTMRSNLGVGLPIDVLVLKRDALKPELNYRIDAEDHYFSDLRHRWSEALREAHLGIPKPPYKTNGKP